MAWEAGDLDRVVAALGYPATAEGAAKVQRAMDAIAMDESIARIQSYLAEVTLLSDEIATERSVAGSELLPQYQSQGRRYSKLLGQALNIDVQGDYW
jgi:hypothetical protein